MPPGALITLERVAPDRLMVSIERRKIRRFSLGLDEAALLAELIRLELEPPPAVRDGIR